MDTLIASLIEFLTESDNPLGLLIIAACALLEYVFPPFPGDTITLLGAVLVTAHGWSFLAVFGAVMAGSVAGSMAAFYLGGWLGQRRRSSAGEHARLDPSERATLDRLVEGFRRHGAAYLIINRFLPGIRTLFFVAAGMAGMRPAAVCAYSAISAALWNLGIMALGSVLGANFEVLIGWVRRYTMAVWGVVFVMVVALILRAIIRRQRARRRPR